MAVYKRGEKGGLDELYCQQIKRVELCRQSAWKEARQLEALEKQK